MFVSNSSFWLVNLRLAQILGGKRMNEFIPKWQKELDIFDKIKPIIILEGNVLDKYQYPGDDNMQSGSILRLTEYLHYHFKNAGY